MDILCKNNRNRTIFIQKDNARPHISIDDPEFLHYNTSYEVDILLICQLPNSPVMNVLDLEYFFRHIS